MRGGWDIHTHLVPVDIRDVARSGKYGMRLGNNSVQVHRFNLNLASMGQPDMLLHRIESDCLDGAVAAAPPPMFRADLPAVERRDYVDWLNDGVLRATASDRRLRAVAYLSTDMPEMAFEVASALSDEWAGVIVGTDLGPHSYADDQFHHLWQCWRGETCRF